MNLKLLAALAVAVCLLSLAARSAAIRAATPAPEAQVLAAPAASEEVALAAIDGHLRTKLVRMARR